MHRAGSGVRRLIGLLVLLNIGLFVAGWVMQYLARAPDYLPAFNADKIVLMAADDAPDAGVADDARASPPEAVAEPTVPPQAGVTDCLRWRALDAAGVARLEAHLRERGVPERAYDLLAEMPGGASNGWWVYVPPLPDEAAAQAVIADARARGVTDLAPVRGGAMRNAVSLGVFRGLADAREHAARMSALGVRAVVYGPRPQAGLISLTPLAGPDSLKALKGAWPAGLAPDACAASG